MSAQLVFPFSAIVGQQRAKLGLILNAIDPTIGGVLLTGPKGSGKSTIVRSANGIFPEVEVAAECPYRCSPKDMLNMCEDCRVRLQRGALLTRKERMRLVQVPVGATEDRLVGSLDVESVIKKGSKVLQLGLLAMANQGVLYLDEVNLLPDHIIDTILDAASSGWNIIEREGISTSHPAHFILVGSMNPEEGDLRPQILDRFGLHASTENLTRPSDRTEVIRRNLEFSRDPDAFMARYLAQDEVIRQHILDARLLLSSITIPDIVLESVAKLHTSLKVDGYRPDIVTIRTARALAAYDGRSEVEPADMYLASELALTHRTRDSGMKTPPSVREIREAFEETPVASSVSGTRRRKLRARALREMTRLRHGENLSKLLTNIALLLAMILIFLFFSGDIANAVAESPLLLASGILLSASLGIILGRRAKRPRTVPSVKLLDLSRITNVQTSGPKFVVEDSDGGVRTPSIAEPEKESRIGLEANNRMLSEAEEVVGKTEPIHPKATSSSGERPRRGTQFLVGKRAKVVASSSRGRYVWHEIPKEKPRDIAFGPTLRAASPYQRVRQRSGLAVTIKPEDVRTKMREYRAPFSIVLVVDMSLSMANSIVNLGRAVFSLHRSVYRRRDRVALVVFKGDDAAVLQQPTTNLGIVVRKLWTVGTSDFTPIAIGMLRAWRLLRLEKQRNKDVIPMMILVSDGIANIPLTRPLSTWGRRMFMSKAQADVLDVAHIMNRTGVRSIVINTSHRSQEIPGEAFKKIPDRSDWFTPTEFLMEISRVLGGSYYGLSLTQEPTMRMSKTKLDDWFYLEAKAK